MVIVLMGVSGSGKSTIGAMLAKRLGWSFYDGDDFHSEANKAKMAAGQALTDDDRSGWLRTLRQLIFREIEANRNMVLACSTLKESYREQLKVNDHVYFVFLRGTYQQIESRMRLRADHFMKPNMLQSQFDILEEPVGSLTIDIQHTPEEIISTICKELIP